MRALSFHLPQLSIDEICCSAYPLPMASVCLDNMSFWTPSVTEELKAASPSQHRPHDRSPSLSEPFSALDGHADDLRTSCGQSPGQPILIPSDIESDMSVTDGSDAKQDDGGESDSSLPSLEALVARQATLRRDKTSRKGTLSRGTSHFRDLYG